jgi:hypothetical protein
MFKDSGERALVTAVPSVTTLVGMQQAGWVGTAEPAETYI